MGVPMSRVRDRARASRSPTTCAASGTPSWSNSSAIAQRAVPYVMPAPSAACPTRCRRSRRSAAPSGRPIRSPRCSRRRRSAARRQPSRGPLGRVRRPGRLRPPRPRASSRSGATSGDQIVRQARPRLQRPLRSASTSRGATSAPCCATFSEISGLNIVIDPAVQGSVDVALSDVPWDQALDIILRANKLGYIVDGTIVRIAPLTVLADEEGQRRKLADEQALAGELRVLTRTLSYAQRRGAADAPDAQRAVAARHRPGRSAHQHADHHRPAGSAADRHAADRHARQARSRRSRSRRASSRPTGTSRARSACSGASTGESIPRSATRRTSPSRTAGASPAASGRSRVPDGTTPTAVNLPRRRGDERRRPRARFGQRRVQPRRRADRARAVGQRPDPVDAARVDAEQRRGARSRRACRFRCRPSPTTPSP